MRTLLIFLIIVLQFIIGYLFYKDHQSCCDISAPVSIEPVRLSAPLTFDWSSSSPLTTDKWFMVHDSLIQLIGKDQKLEMTALLCQDEIGSISVDSLGKARLEKVRLLFPELTEQQLILSILGTDCTSWSKSNANEAVTLRVLTITENIVETADETLIYFPSNSIKKINSTEVETYLKKIAQRVIKSNEKIQLTGHTDDDGDVATNLALGQKRADIIKTYLVELGVSPQNISSISEGENKPIGDNKTPEGKAKNRRTVLKIIPLQ
ncbi:MAG: OmpA family protein [Saprospiraceae bacterium]